MKAINFIIVLFLAINFSACDAQNSFTNINQKEMIDLMKDESIVVIDVRTPGEVSQGYLKGTDHFFNINSSDFEENIKSLDPEKTYIVYCKSSARSSKAANYMASSGFTKIYNLKGGMMSWSDKNYITK